MKAGFGKSDITPRIGVELYGFGAYLNRHSTAVRDRLEARAVAFEINDSPAVVIGCDLCALETETIQKIRKVIATQVRNIKPEAIMVNCSHTHSSPAATLSNQGMGCPDPVYVALLPQRIAKAGIDALNSLTEAVVLTAEAPCRGIGFNRVYDTDCSHAEALTKDDWQPSKPELTDTVCRVIRIDDMTGTMMGFMVYFGCHPVVCCAQNTRIHGDFPGIAIHEVMRQYPGSIGVFLQGACGDVNCCGVGSSESECLRLLDGVAFRFANAIREGLATAKKIEIDVLSGIVRQYGFTVNAAFSRDLVSDKSRELRGKVENSFDDNDDELQWAVMKLQGSEKMLEALEAQCKSIFGELHVLRLGPFAFMATPFEVMQAIKNDVVKNAKAPIPLVISESGHCGYAPDNQSLRGMDGKPGYASYATITASFIMGHLPFGNIHEELVNNLLELDMKLFHG